MCRRVSLAIKNIKRKGFLIFVQNESMFFNDVQVCEKYCICGPERLVMSYRHSYSKIIIYGIQSDTG